MSGLATFQVLAGATGGRIVVNGQDVTGQVAGARLDLDPRDVPRLTLQLLGAGEVEGEGIVQITRDGQAEAAAWLAGLDPEALGAEALNRGGFGRSPAAAMLEVLVEWATGEAPGDHQG